MDPCDDHDKNRNKPFSIWRLLGLGKVMEILSLLPYVNSSCMLASERPLTSALVHQVFIIIEQVTGQREVSASTVFDHPIEMAAGHTDVCRFIQWPV